MRMLVFGAGPIGCLFAARLQQGGHDVTLIARGETLQNLEKNGIQLTSWNTGEKETVNCNLISELKPQDKYDLVLVIMRRNSALRVLPILSANQSAHFLFLGNNAAGPEDYVQALGEERVLIGFPGAAGYREGRGIVYINAEESRPARVYIGTPNGEVSGILCEVAGEIGKGKFLEPVIQENMDAWLKCHTALLFPSIAPALYLCENDNYRMARTRDALVLAFRAIREGFSVLKKLDYPILPRSYRLFQYIPEPIMILLLGRLFKNPGMEVAMVRHAEAIRDEVQQLNNEFMVLVEESGMFTPTIQFLVDQYNRKAPHLPDGSRSIRMNWSSVLVIPIVLMLFILIGLLVF